MPTYYAVDRRRAFKQNEQFNLLDKPLKENQLIASVADIFESGLSPHGMNYLMNEHLHAQNNANQPSPMIEYALELLRQQKYSTKPSRFISIFGCETLDAAKHFRGQYFPHKLTTPIYEIISSKEVHRGDMNLLDSRCPIYEFDNRLNAYWSEESNPLHDNYEPFWELVIPLPIRVGAQVA